MQQTERIEAMFQTLVEQIRHVLPVFGKHLAMDNKTIASFAAGKNKNEKADGRRDTDADYGKKEYRGMREDGTL